MTVQELPLQALRISKSALLHNCRSIRRSLEKKVKLFAVVKSNAYGHGLREVSTTLSPLVDGFCVAQTDEALALRKIIASKRIIAVTYFTTLNNSYLRVLSKKRIEVPLASFETLKTIQKNNVPLSVHIKIDSGTTRIGFLPDEIAHVLRRLEQSPHIRVAGVYSHFAEAEDTASPFTDKQLIRFTQAAKSVVSRYPQAIRHIACSAAIKHHSQYQLDAVRPGIHLYGLSGLKYANHLEPVMTATSRILQLKNIPASTSIGYNRSYTTSNKSKIAIIPFGYFEGMPRFASNKGFVLIHGSRAPIRGKVCMNLCMVDCTAIPKAKVGDEVILFGANPRLTASTVASWGKTINYEIVSRMNPLLKRILV